MVIVVVFEYFLATKMRAGRNWARILLAVVGGLSLVGGAFGLDATFAMLPDGWEGAVVGGIALLSFPLDAAAIVFMYLPSARPHFAASAAPKSPEPAE